MKCTYNETTGYTPNELHFNKSNDRFWNKNFYSKNKEKMKEKLGLN